MPLTRTPHWATREFHQFLVARAREPFAWGKNDCCLFVADAIQSFTGVDLADDFRGKYSDEASAFALIKSVTGGSTVADAALHCAKTHGLHEWEHPLQAQRGDLVIVQNAGQIISGIVHLNGRTVAVVGPAGLKLIPIGNIARSWHV
ncbi:MAG TPA: hypothetical protein VGT04_07030 [Acidobacteriaceae bacterium]|nr:hypothetical protein [Acidobacteriaceae bacterium]